MMMRKCWVKEPNDRPTFNELYSNISKYMGGIANYLEMNINPEEKRGRRSCDYGISNRRFKGEKREDFQFLVIPP